MAQSKTVQYCSVILPEITNLPDHVLLHLLDNLPLLDLFRSRLVCHRWSHTIMIVFSRRASLFLIDRQTYSGLAMLKERELIHEEKILLFRINTLGAKLCRSLNERMANISQLCLSISSPSSASTILKRLLNPNTSSWINKLTSLKIYVFFGPGQTTSSFSRLRNARSNAWTEILSFLINISSNRAFPLRHLTLYDQDNVGFYVSNFHHQLERLTFNLSSTIEEFHLHLPVISLALSSANFLAQILNKLHNFERLQKFSLTRRVFNEEAFSEEKYFNQNDDDLTTVLFEHLPEQLVELSLHSPTFIDHSDCIRSIAVKCPNLQHLSVDITRLHLNKALLELAKLTKLKSLRLTCINFEQFHRYYLHAFDTVQLPTIQSLLFQQKHIGDYGYDYPQAFLDMVNFMRSVLVAIFPNITTFRCLPTCESSQKYSPLTSDQADIPPLLNARPKKICALSSPDEVNAFRMNASVLDLSCSLTHCTMKDDRAWSHLATTVDLFYRLQYVHLQSLSTGTVSRLFEQLSCLKVLRYLRMPCPRNFFHSYNLTANTKVSPISSLVTLHLDLLSDDIELNQDYLVIPCKQLFRLSKTIPNVEILKIDGIRVGNRHECFRLLNRDIEWFRSLSKHFHHLSQIWLLKSLSPSASLANASHRSELDVFNDAVLYDYIHLLQSNSHYNNIVHIIQQVLTNSLV